MPPSCAAFHSTPPAPPTCRFLFQGDCAGREVEVLFFSTPHSGVPRDPISIMTKHRNSRSTAPSTLRAWRLRLLPFLGVLLWSSLGAAQADAPETSANTEVGTSTSSTEPTFPPNDFRQLALSPLSWELEPGQGVGLGAESGAWGHWLSQGIRITVPFGRHCALNLRGLFVMDIDPEEDTPFKGDFGGRLEFIGRSAVLLNVVRVYGGGGLQAFRPTFDTTDRDLTVGFGGQFGFEFFPSPHQAMFLEVGGQGPSPSPGVTVTAGLNFYPWTE